jgi:allantoate deiminase
MTTQALARKVMRRADLLGKISDEPGRLTRLSWSPAMHRANDQVTRWMHEAGMTAREDPIGNLIGRWPSSNPKAKTFLIGSHLDTVRGAGKYDGVLGVLAGIACVERLRRERRKLPFHLEVVGFADEEGVHFQSAYLGSGAWTGSTTRADLQRKDEDDVTLAESIRRFGGDPDRLSEVRRRREELLGYAEVHIEQGPVLESRRTAVGVVTHIVGITRARLTFRGVAGHAGTTPMDLRHDALCAAAEFVLAVEEFARERKGLVATIGELNVTAGAVNVIPGSVTLSLDVRHADDRRRGAACARLRQLAGKIGTRRGVRVDWQPRAETKAVACSSRLVGLLRRAAGRFQKRVPMLISGAGHDAAELARLTPVTMLFVRCKNGISHNPAESVQASDVAVAIETMNDFLDLLARRERE